MGMAVHEFTFTHNGRTFRCRVDTAGQAGGMARPSNPVWLVEVDGASHTPFDASLDDSTDDVQRRVTEWFDSTRRPAGPPD